MKTKFQDFVEIVEAVPLKPVPRLASLEEQELVYYVDSNIPNLLAFHPSYPLTTTFAQEYEHGKIILQDKASCIPAHLLDVGIGQHVLDACAAPGNKTTQLAAAIGPTGHVIGVEKDRKRVETLKKMVEKAGASDCLALIVTSDLVTTILNADFTTLDPLDRRFANVTHILLDPSCSGSGLDRLDYDTSDSDLSSRLRNLSTFQSCLLKHALSFPSVERVVYSTCSHYAEENERVVTTILSGMTGWRVLRRDEQPSGLKEWPRRGLPEECPSEDIAQGCIRCEKGTDGTIGFFAVGFVRDRMNSDGDNDGEDEVEEWHGIP